MTCRYLVRFADGKSATVIDPAGEDARDMEAAIRSRFREGYVVEVVRC